MPTSMACPACSGQAIGTLKNYANTVDVTCAGCGSFETTVDLPNLIPPVHRPRLSHKIRKMQGGGTKPVITRELAKQLTSEPLPSIRQQCDAFILWAGDDLRQSNPDAFFPIKEPGGPRLLTAMIGAFDIVSAWRIIGTYLPSDGLAVHTNPSGRQSEMRLTTKGWDRYEELKRSIIESRLAFMAMPFGDPVIDSMFATCFKPAVEATGFELLRVTDRQKAGLIDDQLRVAIRRSRFTVAELTGSNNGAYWEAGFSEGLNRPVIYTCERSYFDSAATKPHFDTNHCSTVIWETKEPEKAAEELKDRIRATLPDEAKMND